MSFIVVGAAAVTVGATLGGMYMGGKGAQTEEEKEVLEKAALGVKQEKLGLLGEQKGLALVAAQSQYTTGMEELGLGTRMGTRNIQTGGTQAMAQSGLATSGTIEGKMQTQMKDLLAGAKTTAAKQMDIKKLAGAEADLRFRTGKDTIESSYQGELDTIAAQPTGWLEGMFS